MRNIDMYEEQYIQKPGEQYQVFYRRSVVLEQLKKYNHQNILEIGCGMEPLFQFVDDYEELTIVEPGIRFAENAKRLSSRQRKDIRIINDFIENASEELKNRKKDFDYIVLSALLHEVEKPKILLEKVYSICNDNTVVHVNVPNARSLHRLLAKEMGIIDSIYEISLQGSELQQHSVFDMDSLIKAVDEVGFEVIDRGSFFPKILSAQQMEQMLKGGIVDESIFEGLDRLGKFLPEYGSEIFVQIRKK